MKRRTESETSPASKSDAEKLLDTLNGEAAVARGMWITFNSLMAFLAITALSITHRDLLYDNPVTLPLLSVAIPLSWFAVLAPALLIVIHFSVLLQHGLLARKAVAFQQLTAGNNNHSQQQKLRLRAASYFFVQNIIAPEQNPMLKQGMRVMSWLTFDVLPLALLLLFQFQFLPYQDDSITWPQRILVLVGSTMVWLFGLVRRQPTMSMWQTLKQMGQKNPFAGFALLFIVTISAICSVFIATGAHERDRPYDFSSMMQDSVLFNTASDEVTGKPASLFSQRLVLPGLDIQVAALNSNKANFRGRNFVDADFSGGNLFGADFTASDLSFASFENSILSRARFDCASRSLSKKDKQVQESSHLAIKDGEFLSSKRNCTKLVRANFSNAKLLFATLVGSDFEAAKFVGADMRFSQFIGSNFFAADLRDATLSDLPFHADQPKLESWVVGTRTFISSQETSGDFVDLRGADIANWTIQFESQSPTSRKFLVPNMGREEDVRRLRIRHLEPWSTVDKLGKSSRESPDLRDAFIDDSNPIDSEVNFELSPEERSVVDKYVKTANASRAQGQDLLFAQLNALQEREFSDPAFRSLRTQYLTAKLCNRPRAVETIVDRYFDKEISKNGGGRQLGWNLFITPTFAFGTGGYGGCGGCSGPLQGDPNFDTRNFSLSIKSCPAYDGLDRDAREAIDYWSME
jgi:uncharacterized protein YjbI with pentapeptide repeats